MSRAILGLTRKRIEWNMYIEEVKYTIIDGHLVMSFLEDANGHSWQYFMVWEQSGKLLELDIDDLMDKTDTYKTDTCKLWDTLTDAAEKRGLIHIESLADMKPSNDPVPIMFAESLSDINVNTVD